MSRKKIILVQLLAALGWLSVAQNCRGDEPSQEYKLKAAFIYNFARFIEWPNDAFADDNAPFVIAVVGADPFKGALEQVMNGKKVGGRSVEIHHFASSDNIGSCQILFVSGTDADSISRVLQKVGRNHVLTIGESDDFTSSGGGLRFFTEDDRIRFEINTSATDCAGLKISSKLLKLARIFKQ